MSSRITMYGIKNCDTVRKARGWMDGNGVAYEFHDYKVSGVGRSSLERWCAEHGWEKICNRAGTTFRNLPDRDKSNLNEAKAIALMLDQPSMIKRPIVEADGRVLVGFSPDTWRTAFSRRPLA